MLQRIVVGISMMLAVFFLTWVVADAAVGMPAPEITTDTWLNGDPLRLSDLKGKVVMIEFWTFGCYNCRNVEPYVKQWHQKYADHGLVIIGVHWPEFAYEHDVEKVERYVKDHDIRFPFRSTTTFRHGTGMAIGIGLPCI
ncbi:MAG TPA: redoxin domain-containing protein [Nitrospiraceae bacterium]|nr:redoxin domain-containing protein [Nitrospiraceae bacterium]